MTNVLGVRKIGLAKHFSAEVTLTVARFAFSFGAAAFGRGAKAKRSAASVISLSGRSP